MLYGFYAKSDAHTNITIDTDFSRLQSLSHLRKHTATSTASMSSASDSSDSCDMPPPPPPTRGIPGYTMPAGGMTGGMTGGSNDGDYSSDDDSGGLPPLPDAGSAGKGEGKDGGEGNDAIGGGRDIAETFDIALTTDPATGFDWANEYCFPGVNLGRGSFGRVKRAERRFGDVTRRFAVKVLSKRELERKRFTKGSAQSGLSFMTALDLVRDEIKVMRSLYHRHVCLLFEVMEDENDKLYLVIENLPGGQLMEFTAAEMRFSHKGSGKVLPEAMARYFYCDIFLGLEYLHSEGVAHRDIKPENILISAAGRAVIADFGCARVFVGGAKEGGMVRDTQGTYAFLSPEGCSGDPYSAYDTDWWALGVSLFAMVYGKLPFWGDGAKGLFDAISEAPIAFPSPPAATANGKVSSKGIAITDLAQSFLTEVLSKDSAARPSSAELREHVWLRDALVRRNAAAELAAASAAAAAAVCAPPGAPKDPHWPAGCGGSVGGDESFVKSMELPASRDAAGKAVGVVVGSGGGGAEGGGGMERIVALGVGTAWMNDTSRSVGDTGDTGVTGDTGDTGDTGGTPGEVMKTKEDVGTFWAAVDAFASSLPDGVRVLIDTVQSSEEITGNALADASYAAIASKALVAAQWGGAVSRTSTKGGRGGAAAGEGKETEGGVGETDYTVDALQRSVAGSLIALGRVDVLYTNFSSNVSSSDALSVLRNKDIAAALLEVRSSGRAGRLGVSFASERAFETACSSPANLLELYDVVKVPATLALKRVDLMETLKGTGKMVVVRSAARHALNECTGSLSVGQLLRYLTATEEVTTVLIESTCVAHLRDNIAQIRGGE